MKYLESINVISFWYVDKAHSSPTQIEEQFKLSELYIQKSPQLPFTSTSTSTNSGNDDGRRSVNGQSPQPPLPLQSKTTTKETSSSSSSSSSSSAGAKKVGGLNIQHSSSSSSSSASPNQVITDVTGNSDGVGVGNGADTLNNPTTTSMMSEASSSSSHVRQSKDKDMMSPEEIEAHYEEQTAAMRKQGTNKPLILSPVSFPCFIPPVFKPTFHLIHP